MSAEKLNEDSFSSSHLLQALLDSALDCVITMTQEGTILEWNQVAATTFGYAREEAIGQELASLIVPHELREAHRKGLAHYFATGEGPVLGNRIEVPALRRDGTTFPVELAISPFHFGGKTLFTGTIRDITERKRVEAELIAARDLAEAANLAKSQFIANMSHELRTPLNAIIGYSEILWEEAQSEEQSTLSGDLHRIYTAGKHLLALINNILDLSKIEAGKMGVYAERVSVSSLVAETAATVQPLMEGNRNQLHVVCPPDTGEMFTDGTKLRQSLLNLLSNAAKFTKDGTVTLTVTRQTASEGDKVAFQIADTGIGMDTETLTRLFVSFSQADNSTTRRYGGTGLGLAITRHFCQMLGGEVEVESTLGQGSVFTICLPAILPSAREQNSGSSFSEEPL